MRDSNPQQSPLEGAATANCANGPSVLVHGLGIEPSGSLTTVLQTVLAPYETTHAWYLRYGSNARPSPCKGAALPTELQRQYWRRVHRFELACPEGLRFSRPAVLTTHPTLQKLWRKMQDSNLRSLAAVRFSKPLHYRSANLPRYWCRRVGLSHRASAYKAAALHLSYYGITGARWWVQTTDQEVMSPLLYP